MASPSRRHRGSRRATQASEADVNLFGYTIGIAGLGRRR
jgi:hypothetical protein